MNFVCPECKKALKQKGDKLVCEENHVFSIKNGIYNLLPQKLNNITKEDAKFHSAVREEWVEINQLDEFRNFFYYNQVLEFLKDKSEDNSTILELGGGVGYDLLRFLKKDPKFNTYIFSDVSFDSASFASEHIRGKKIIFCSIDANKIPLPDESVDIVYMIAALHHFPDVDRAFSEIYRIVKPGGYIVFGLEPNKIMLNFLRFAKLPFKRIFATNKLRPAADDVAEGFSVSNFIDFSNKYNLKIIILESVRFLTGIIQFGLEGIFRIFKPKRRVRIPGYLDKAFLYLDRIILSYSPLKAICWHYTVAFQKRFHQLTFPCIPPD
jgi:ubiquinone/menaquinone biosynthesis C-methylase UbiE